MTKNFKLHEIMNLDIYTLPNSIYVFNIKNIPIILDLDNILSNSHKKNRKFCIEHSLTTNYNNYKYNIDLQLYFKKSGKQMILREIFYRKYKSLIFSFNLVDLYKIKNNFNVLDYNNKKVLIYKSNTTIEYLGYFNNNLVFIDNLIYFLNNMSYSINLDNIYLGNTIVITIDKLKDRLDIVNKLSCYKCSKNYTLNNLEIVDNFNLKCNTCS